MTKKKSKSTCKKEITVSPALKFTIETVVGDRGGDGHEKTRTSIIRANLSVDDIMTVYRTASKKLKLDPINKWFVDYEDASIPKNDRDLLFKTFPDLMKEWDIQCAEDLNEVSWGWDDNNMEVVGRIIQTELPDFRWESVNDIERLDLGGYGLL